MRGNCSSIAGVIQLVECQLPKLDVAGSSPVARSHVSYCLANAYGQLYRCKWARMVSLVT